MGIVNVVMVLKKKIIFGLVVIIIIVGYIFVNSRPQTIKLLPNLVGMDIKDAKEILDEYNVKLNIKEEYNNYIDKNKIISQSIGAGIKIDSINNLEVIISKGKIPVEVYEQAKVNEMGNIPIMMYHGIHNLNNSDTFYIGGNVDKDGYQRTVEAFRNDLEMYYKSGYRMIRLTDYVDGKIDVELGKSPIIITFDDGLENNIKVVDLDDKGNIIIDPNCAIGILEEFKDKYPDFNVTATFFVNGSLFNQEKYNDQILNWLIDNGYDIGNHSMTHVDFTKIDSSKTIEEIGYLYKLLDSKIPNNYVNIVALPFGSPYKKSHSNFDHIISGSINDYKYETKATLRVGWEADYSPFDINFDPLFIKRIRAYDNNGKEFDIEMNFRLLENRKYISDGDVNTITIPDEQKNNLNNIKNLEVITY